MPLLGQSTRSLSSVVSVAVDAEEAPELVLGADVVAGEDMQPAQAAQQRVLRGPATDAANGGQTSDRRQIVKLFQSLEVEVPGRDRSRELDDRAGLGMAEPVRFELVRVVGRQRLGAREPRGPAWSSLSACP